MGGFGGAIFGGPVSGTLRAGDLIYTASRICGLLARAGRGNATAELTDGLNALNSMIDGWNTEKLMLWASERLVYSATAGTGEYTIGPAGQWLRTRPLQINTAGVLLVNSSNPPIEQPMAVTDNAEDWALIWLKALPSTVPTTLYYDRAWPDGRCHLWPVPSVNIDIALYLTTQITGFDTEDDVVDVPQGYRRALEYNLALELSNRFPEQTKMSQTSIDIANNSKAWLKQNNAQPPVMGFHRALLRRPRTGFNIYSGE